MWVGNPQWSARAYVSLTGFRITRNPETKVGSSEPLSPLDEGYCLQKSYHRDNRVVAGKSTYRPGGLLPRCRFFPSWPCSSGQGLGCSPIKGDRELGLDRRETGRLLSIRGVLRSEGKLHLVREELCNGATGGPVVCKASQGSYALKDKS